MVTAPVQVAAGGWTLDGLVEVEMSSRHSAGQRRLPELLAKGAAADPVIVAERSRMGRSLHQVPALNYPAKLLRPLSPNASA